jgi:ABC-type multidrug transport system ATPase subunit
MGEARREAAASGALDPEKSPINVLSLRAVDSVDITVGNLCVDVDVSSSRFSRFKSSFQKKKKNSQQQQQQQQQAESWKAILHGINACMPCGSLTAIIGGSGSGKTSMLNALARRIGGKRLKVSGSILYNGDPRLSSIRSAYVMQHDILIPTLTVRETLLYAAELRLPPPTTSAERRQVVEDIILELGLKECANTRIGDNVHKGCSGGEKRRTSLGVQMLANPSVLFLDEVTTGLDATSAFQLIRTLKTLAEKGRTVMVTIHQPRSEIWGLFDRLILLSGGYSLYSGSAHDCLPHFAHLNYPLPLFVNPADHLIDLAAVDTRSPELEATSVARVEGLKKAWRQQSECQMLGFNGEKPAEHTQAPGPAAPGSGQTAVSRQVRVLTGRTLKVTLRDPLGLIASLLEAIAMGVLMGWIFVSLDGSLAGIRSRQGAVYTAAALQGYIILIFEAYRLTRDIEVFDRENSEGVVGVPAFLMSRRLTRTFVEDLPVPLIFSIIFYFMVGFRHLPGQFFIFLAINVLSHYIALTFATLCVALSRNFAGASLIANMGFTIQSLGCGYFVQTNQIPVYMRWLKVSSPGGPAKWIGYSIRRTSMLIYLLGSGPRTFSMPLAH